MKSMQKLFSRENLKTFLIWNVGAFITAVGAYFFKYPNHFSFGGVSGITVVLGHYFPELSLGGINWVLNLALLVLGAVMLGKSFGVSTAYVTVSMSAFLSLFEVLFPMSQPLTDQPLLELIFGVLLPSVGAAVLFNVGASTGGTDIIAMILKKYTSADIGSALFLADFFIAAAAFPAFGATTGLFSLLGLGTKSLTVNFVMENMNLSKSFTIITDNPDPICRFIVEDLNRSASTYRAEGIYTHQDQHRHHDHHGPSAGQPTPACDPGSRSPCLCGYYQHQPGDRQGLPGRKLIPSGPFPAGNIAPAFVAYP